MEHEPVICDRRRIVYGLFRYIVALFFLLHLLPANAASPQQLRDNVPSVVAHLSPVARLSESKSLDLVITLPLRNQEQLTNLLRQIADPASPHYHHYLTPAEFAEQFGPAENDYQAVLAFARSNGLAITGRHANRTLLDVNGPVNAIEQAFHVHLHTYHHPTEARTFYAPDAEPTANLATPVLSISGLDNFILPRPMGIITNFLNEPLDGIPLATGSGPRGNFIGKDFRAAYAPGTTLNGSGQAVGLFELDAYYPGDIADYENLAGLPAVPLTNVVVDFPILPGGNNVEVALDIDMAIAMAPGLSQVIVYEGVTANDVLNRMATDDLAKQLSCSWSFGLSIDPAREQIFEQFAAQGQTFFQATGDLGAGPVYPPADDLLVTAVGGTSLATSSTNGAWESETTWPESSGGISASYSIPVWQQGISMVTNRGSTTMRNVPDVACLADGEIWLVANNGEQVIVGGTSAAAPLWAGFAALVNQQAAANSQPALGFLNPAIYALGESTNYPAVFHDIAAGNNTNSLSPTNFFAVPGYDLCTGWGTPNGANLINAFSPPPDALQLAPETGVAFAGLAGGSPVPATQNFYLVNAGTDTLNWSLGNTSVWFSVSPASGSLAPGGTSSILVTPAAATGSLPAGQYTATLFSTNLNDGFAVNRQLALNLVNPVQAIAGVVFSNLYSFTGGADGANPNGLLPATNGIFVGTAQNGGTNAAGTVFEITTNGLLSSLYSFTGGNDGASPFAPLTQGADGNFYGTTFQGGDDGNGTIFSITPAGDLTTVLAFGITNGDLPFAGLTLGTDGNFYGTTYQGGASGRGTAYRLATNGTLTTLHSFSNGSDGGHVAAGLIEGQDGNFYGTTWKGGNYAEGTVFDISTNGTLTTLVSLESTNGTFPFAGLTQDTEGNFYGVTSSGGSVGNGAVFEITAAGQFTNLYSFSGESDGANPRATLLLGADGNLYGTTANGGTSGQGTVFVISPEGVLTTLVEFNGFSGANPQTPLAQGTDGWLYGSTQNGGANGEGTIFKVAINSAPQITGQPSGQSVFAGANIQFSATVLGSLPLFYQWQKNGTNLTDGGPVAGSNSRLLNLSQVTTNDSGNYSVIISNALGQASSSNAVLLVNSSAPVIVSQPAGLTLAAGAAATFSVGALGNLPLIYQWQMNGTNLSDHGGISGSISGSLTISNVTVANDGGYAVVISNALGQVTSSNVTLTVMSASAPGTGLSTLHWFNSQKGVGGGWPPNGLMVASNGDIYGTTEFGSVSNYTGAGTIFQLTSNGLFSTLVSFNGVNGFGPLAPLVEDAGGNFYGTTTFGGTNEVGNIFELTADGLLTNIYSFSGDENGVSTAGLIHGTNNDFYGVTIGGGDYDSGSIFRLEADGTVTNLYSFTGGLDGSGPVGALLRATDGNFYGMTGGGGTNGYGTVFKMASDATVTSLYPFALDSNGYIPTGALVQGTDGNLYGVTGHNIIQSLQFYGTIFKISTNGALSTLYPLNYTDGAYPYAGLTLGSDGNFYGTTYSGANDTDGTVFRITPAGNLTTLVVFDGFNDGAHPESALVEGLDGALYGTTTADGPGGHGTLFRLSFTSAPQITWQPVSQTAGVGATLSFSVAVLAAPPRFYQWQKNGTNLMDTGPLSGSTNRILTLTNLSLADSGSYSVIVSNAQGFVTSSNALLTVVARPVPTISTSPGGITLTWSAITGQNYQLQYAVDLSSANWTNLGNVIHATNGVVSVADVIGTNGQRFYRVVLSP